MCVKAVVLSIVAWVIGLFADANLGGSGGYEGFLMLRIILPILVMGLFIIKSNGKK